MVAQMVASWSVVGIVVAASIAAAGTPKRLTIASASGYPLFGELVRADGDLVVSADTVKNDSVESIARILRVNQGRVVEDARLPFAGERIVAIDVSNNRVAVKLGEAQEIAILERARAWTQVDTIKLAGECRYTGWWIDLAKDVLVVRGDEAICVFEKRGRWTKVATLPPANAMDYPVTNGDRIAQQVVVGFDGVRLSKKVNGTWKHEQDVRLPKDRQISHLAISDRWLALGTQDLSFENERVEIYALGATKVSHAATLPVTALDDLAISNDRLIVKGTTHTLFELRGTVWREVGTIPKVAGASETIAVGDSWWVGRHGGKGIPPGVIEGYSPDRP